MRQFTTGVERRDTKIEVVSSEKFIEEMVPHKTIHFMSRVGLAQPVRVFPKYVEEKTKTNPKIREQYLQEFYGGERATSKFVLALHSAFSDHIPFSLSPEVIMGIISQEVAQFVKDNSDNPSIAALFTRNPEQKEQLIVEVNHFVYGSPKNDWLQGINVFRNMLAERVPSDTLSVMTPKLSGATLETEVAHLVSFMDAASKYYHYGMSTMCGIPEFRIEGTSDDWNEIIKSVARIGELLPGLKDYVTNLTPVLVEIRNVVDGNDINKYFWSSIYKEDDGSGGPYSNGWFNNFYAHVYSMDYRTRTRKVTLKSHDGYGERRFGGLKLNNYPANLSIVPFEWNYFGKLIPMSFVAGVTSVEYTDGFLTPRLGVGVLELEPAVK